MVVHPNVDIAVPVDGDLACGMPALQNADKATRRKSKDRGQLFEQTTLDGERTCRTSCCRDGPTNAAIGGDHRLPNCAPSGNQSHMVGPLPPGTDQRVDTGDDRSGETAARPWPASILPMAVGHW